MDREYDDGYLPAHPELIPPDETETEAGRRLARLLDTPAADLPTLDHQTFLEGWWSLHWLWPGLHPDDQATWPEETVGFLSLANEARRRCDEGGIADDEYYCAEAVHHRVWQERFRDTQSSDNPQPTGPQDPAPVPSTGRPLPASSGPPLPNA